MEDISHKPESPPSYDVLYSPSFISVYFMLVTLRVPFRLVPAVFRKFLYVCSFILFIIIYSYYYYLLFKLSFILFIICCLYLLRVCLVIFLTQRVDYSKVNAHAGCYACAVFEVTVEIVTC